jgi:putative transposase
MTLYKGKYRVESTRLPNRDYAANGLYFVTICTRDRFCFFGDIINEQMQLSSIGKIAQENWIAIPNHFEHIDIDVYVVMPNHLHGIVVINRPIDNSKTRCIASLQTTTNNKFAPLKPGSLQAIIHSYKASVTRWCRKNGCEDFAWQSRFYEHIINNEASLERIREYILNNPVKWQEDKNNNMNLWI